MSLYEPPPGNVDMESDAERGPYSPHFHELMVDEVGIVIARKPMPNAIPALASASSANIAADARADYLVLFAQNHLDEGEMDRLFYEMSTKPDMPPDTIERVARAIATWGTPRPM